MSDDCDTCRMDRVTWSEIPTCTWKALCDVVDDIANNKRDFIDALTCNDRVLYIVSILVLMFTFRVVFSA